MPPSTWAKPSSWTDVVLMLSKLRVWSNVGLNWANKWNSNAWLCLDLRLKRIPPACHWLFFFSAICRKSWCDLPNIGAICFSCLPSTEINRTTRQSAKNLRTTKDSLAMLLSCNYEPVSDDKSETFFCCTSQNRMKEASVYGWEETGCLGNLPLILKSEISPGNSYIYI